MAKRTMNASPWPCFFLSRCYLSIESEGTGGVISGGGGTDATKGKPCRREKRSGEKNLKRNKGEGEKRATCCGGGSKLRNGITEKKSTLGNRLRKRMREREWKSRRKSRGSEASKSGRGMETAADRFVKPSRRKKSRRALDTMPRILFARLLRVSSKARRCPCAPAGVRVDLYVPLCATIFYALRPTASRYKENRLVLLLEWLANKNHCSLTASLSYDKLISRRFRECNQKHRIRSASIKAHPTREILNASRLVARFCQYKQIIQHIRSHQP